MCNYSASYTSSLQNIHHYDIITCINITNGTILKIPPVFLGTDKHYGYNVPTQYIKSGRLKIRRFV